MNKLLLSFALLLGWVFPVMAQDEHGWVDLGLPSGLLWAQSNIGAASQHDYGDFYAWGETVTKEEYTPGNAAYQGIAIKDFNGRPQYDAATLYWGVPWRMPTSDEMEELLANCDKEWTAVDGIDGMLFTSKANGNTLFIPAAGMHKDAEPMLDGIIGFLWSSTPGDEEEMVMGQCLLFGRANSSVGTAFRSYGLPIRPVREK